MQELEKKLNYTFRNQQLLREALNHSSYANEHRAQGLGSNERLEFLGDSVLGFVTAEYLFARHPDLPEGDLTTEEAVQHYTLVKEILGEDWLNNQSFRFGASRLANNLLSSIVGTETKYF